MKTKLTSYQQGSPANPSPKQGSVRELVMNVRYSQKFSEFYGKQNPNGSWAKTCQDSLQLMEDNTSGKSSMTWPKLGIALDGLCTGQKKLVLFTEGTESSSLPTPQAFDAKDFKKKDLTDKTTKNGKRGGRSNLREVDFENMLATPRASQDHKPIRPLAPSEANGTHGKTLVADIGNELEVKTGSNGESPLRLGLNPEFVEAMMGFPIGWTDLNPSETP